MNRKNIVRVIVFVLLVFSILGCERSNLLENQLLSIAIEQAGKLGYDVKDMDVRMYTDKEQIYKVSDLMIKASGEPPNLENADYVLVDFYSKNTDVPDKKLWIYLDKNTGKMLGYLKGE